MPFLNRRQIAENVRSQAEKDYRKQLRDALANPALTAAQRSELRARLQRVGQSRVYDANKPPRPGAIQLPVSTPAPQPEPVEEPVVESASTEPKLALEDLMGMKKSELVEMARVAGLPISGTKTTLAERLAGQA